MLVHSFVQQQLIQDRQAELSALARRSAYGRERVPYIVESARAALPALAYRVFGIPAPARPAGCGC